MPLESRLMLAAHDASPPGAGDTYRFVAPGGIDTLAVDTASPGVGRIRGTSGGVRIDETFTNVRRVVIDTATHDAAGASADSIRITGPLVVAGLESLTIETGAGADTVRIEIGGTGFPPSVDVTTGDGDDRITVVLAAGGDTAIRIDAGASTGGDGVEVHGTAAADVIAVDGRLVSCGATRIALAAVENLAVAGAGGADTITATGTTVPGRLALRGEGGSDSIRLRLPLAAGSVVVDGDGAAGTFQVIHAFQSGSGGVVPFSSVVLHGGWLYGTSAFTDFVSSAPDVTERAVPGGCVYRVRPDGADFQILKRFSAATPADGFHPFQGLTVVGDRVIGTTQLGGAAAGGTLYAMTLDGGDFRVLHDFGGAGDGSRPYAAPIAVGSTLYGMTTFGGANEGTAPFAALGAGTLYAYDLDTGAYRVERSFTAPGANPFGSLLQVGEWLYGMTSGHRNVAAHGQVFRWRPADSAFEVIHEFAGGPLGGYPYDTLAWDGGRYLYGTTLGFYPFTPPAALDIAALADEGVIFRIDLDSPGRPYRVLHDFSTAVGDGGKPNSAMLVAPDGFLYGIAHGSESLGGTVNGVVHGTEWGTLYRLRPDGSDFTVLHTFDSLAAGVTPMRGLVWEAGSIYGTTATGGVGVPLGHAVSRGGGTVWRYDVVAADSSPADVLTVVLTGAAETVSLTSSGIDIAGRPGVRFSGFAAVSLDAGAGADRVTIDQSAVAGGGGVAYAINGGGGHDVLSVVRVVPGAACDVRSFETIVGPHEDMTWNITGPGTGSCAAVTFSGARNLVGGNRRDVFRFMGGAAGVVGRIDGGGGAGWLDYSAVARGVRVNLTTGVAARVGGRVARIDGLIGSAGGDRLVGGVGGGVIVGHGGGNTLVGGAGRSILIGGAGRNSLIGGRSADILVDGTTRYDTDIDALGRLLATWRSALPFGSLVDTLQSRHSAVHLRVAETVTLAPARVSGSTPRLLAGGGGRGWFLSSRIGGIPGFRPKTDVWTR